MGRVSRATLEILFGFLVCLSDCFAQFIVNVRWRLDLVLSYARQPNPEPALSPMDSGENPKVIGTSEENLRSIIRTAREIPNRVRKRWKGDSILELFEKWLQVWRNLWCVVVALWF